METQTTTQIPEEVASLINTVAERWGYYFGRRVTQSELMKATSNERKQVRAIGKLISAKIGEYLSQGTDVREAVTSMQGELAQVRSVLKQKSAPFNAKMSPLNKAITYLDRVVIPQQLEKATGDKVLPRLQVSDYTIRAITASK